MQGAAVSQSGSWTDLRILERGIVGRQDGYTTADFSAGLERNGWSISAYLKNATDERASLNRSVQCPETVCGAKPYIVPNQPRTLGIKFGQKF